jgi:molybdopterin-binding protein
MMQRKDSIQMSSSSSSTVWNHLAGRVISILHGLTRTTIKVMTEDEVILTTRCSSEYFQLVCVQIGQCVTAHVTADAVLLGTGGIWPGRERWNRWTGRIVLVDPGLSDPMITVKLQGKSCTLKSTGPVVGQTIRPEAWEMVNIVIDPEKVALMPQQIARQSRWAVTSAATYERPRVWLKARVEGVRRAESGCVISLDVGGAHVSALVCGDQDALCEWVPGLPVEMHVDQWDAWLRSAGDGVDAVMCKLMYDTSL